jgi:hypothetical protein
MFLAVLSLQNHAIGHYSKPSESSQHPHTDLSEFVLILSSYLYRVLPNDLFAWDLQLNTTYLLSKPCIFCFIVMYVVSLFSMLSYCLVDWYYLSYVCFLFCIVAFYFFCSLLLYCMFVLLFSSSSSYLVFVFFVLVYWTLPPGRNPIAVNNNNNNNNVYQGFEYSSANVSIYVFLCQKMPCDNLIHHPKNSTEYLKHSWFHIQLRSERENNA